MPFPSRHARHRITLSRQELCMISQSISRDFSPRLFASRAGRQTKSRFTPQELLEISRQISREFAPGKVSHPSRLVLLAVSPRRLHAHWHVAKRRLTSALSETEPKQPMTLRIYTTPEPQGMQADQTAAAPHWFDVAVTGSDGRQDIWLPEPLTTDTGGQFRAVLGETHPELGFTPQIFSNTTRTPQPLPAEARIQLPNAMAPFIMPVLTPATSAGKTASGQGK